MSETFIANIEQIAKDKLKALGLKPKLAFADFIKKDKRFYTTPCQNQKGETVLFKILISSRKENALALKKEIEITNFLSSFPGNDLKIIPLAETNAQQLPYWYLRPYLAGSIIGHHFKIYPVGLEQTTIKQLADNLLSLQSIPLQIKLTTKDINQYETAVKKFENKLKLTKGQKLINCQAISQFLKKQKQCFDKENLVISHGDFTLANVFINRKTLYLTDWELAQMNNIAADLARLWIQTYRYPKWRQSLLRTFLSKLPSVKKANFKQSFRMTVAIEALGEFANNQRKDLRQNMKQTISSALKGFNGLLKL